MKETISIARATLSESTVAQFGKKIKLNLGPNEIAELKAVHFAVSPLTASQSLTYGLYRKGDKVESSIALINEVVEDANWIIHRAIDLGTAAYVGPVLGDSYHQLPEDLVLLGSPQLVIRPNQAASMSATITLYYKIRTVSDNDLSKLMMKYRMG